MQQQHACTAVCGSNDTLFATYFGCCTSATEVPWVPRAPTSAMARACLLAALLACAADSLGTAVVAGDSTAHSASRGDGVACQWDPSNGSTVVARGGVAPLTCSVSAGRGTLAVNAGADEWSGVGKLQLVDTVAMAYRADEVLPKGRLKVKHMQFFVA
jgi:hypothetical protein